MSISDRQIRKLPEELRRELFRYVPRVQLVRMDYGKLHFILLHGYDREDLYFRVLEELRAKIS